MVECSYCNKPAVYINKLTGVKYCAKHFIEYFDKKVRRTIRRYGLFSTRENIIVATSGGKDSLSLLHYLNNLAKKIPGWRISALLIDEGIKNYREYTIRDFLTVVDELNIPYRIVSFREYYGYTLDEIVKIGREKNLPYQPCSYCGVFRRYLLNKISREMNGTVLATAHNIDDTVQTFLLNIIRNSWDKIARLGPVTGVIEHSLFVKRVKPFIEMLDKETIIYALLNNLVKPEFYECPYIEHNIRVYLRKYVNELEEKYPGTKYQLFKSMLSIINILNKSRELLIKGEIMKCRICGELSSHIICRSCLYRYELGLTNPSENSLIEELMREGKLKKIHRNRDDYNTI
ncbi:MAG: TIGR00269 family protein [Desulfurococcaceae archaeon]